MTELPFTPISPNPYIVGNPVRGRAMFFGRDAEFQLIQKRFGQSDHGGLMVFCGERRSGKTSILFQILDHRLGPDFIPVLIDMQSMAVGSEAEFLTRLSEAILEALGASTKDVPLPDFAAASGARSAEFRRFVKSCLKAHPGKKLILLFDEYELFENKIDAGLLSDDVLNILAALIEHESVFMVFTGSQHLEQRRRDYWTILGKSGYKTVSYLEREDALNLIRQPVEGRMSYDDGSVESIVRLTAGQPFYTQAICQSLVDHLNELGSNQADAARVAEVVDGIINNPLPQMIFLWDGLEREDKLVMALLAECVEDGDAYATVDDLLRHLRQKKYPLELDRASAATTLEKLYKSEMLLRSDEGTEPSYAFRMDLWRLWIRRQHSVWQVMREEGLEIRKPALKKFAPLAVGLAVVVAGGLAMIFWPRGQSGGLTAALAGQGFLVLDVQPEDATLRMDGRRVGMGDLRDQVAAGMDHKLELTAPGYADTSLNARVPQDDTLSMKVALRALLGDLRVETVPPDAEVRVDGKLVGKSPVTVRGLGVATPHRVEASRTGYGVASTQASVLPNAVATASLVLEVGKANVMITTDPAGSEIRVDGQARGSSPVAVRDLALGRHVFRAARDGYNAAETTLVVTSETPAVHIALLREAPGVMVIQGDLPAQIYVDGTLVVENVQNSGPRSLSPGAHAVRVILVSGQTIDHSITVRSGERVVYDFSANKETRRPEGGR